MALKITQEMAFAALPVRAPHSHKGTYGKVLAVCGCAPYRGAAALSCLGALRVGAGLVTLAAPECVLASVAGRILEATLLPLPDEAGLAAAAQNATVCLAGCGKEANEATAREMRFVLAHSSAAVLDAGGLCSLAKEPEPLADFAAQKTLVLTPHPGEMARLAGVPVAQVLQMPADVALGYAKKTGAVVALKTHRTLIAAPGGALYQNTTGNPGLARGGSGDILAGMIAGLLAQGLAPEQAALCGVYLHGLAADRCAARRSMQGMLPEDIFDDLCAVFLESRR